MPRPLEKQHATQYLRLVGARAIGVERTIHGQGRLGGEMRWRGAGARYGAQRRVE
jgi:hypothetical protein